MANEIEQTRGQVDSLILRSLLEQDRYGLEIYNEIKNLDNLIGTIKQPTFYNALKRLENAGLLSSYSGGISNGAKRVYYSVTKKGRAYLQDEYTQWQLDDGTLKDYFTDESYFDDEPIKKQRRTRRAAVTDKSVLSDISSSENDYNDNVVNESFTAESAYAAKKSIYLTDGAEETKQINIDNKINFIKADIEKDNVAISAQIANSDVYPKTDYKFQYGVRKFTFENNADDSAKIAEKQKILDELINSDIAVKNDNLEEKNNSNYENISAKNREVFADSLKNNASETADQNNQKLDKSDEIVINDKPIFKEFNTINDNYNGITNERISKVNYIDSLNDIYNNKPIIKTENTDNSAVNSTNTALTNAAPLYYDDYDEEKIKETSFNKLKQKFALENIKLKQYVRSNTPGFYIGRYYYSAKLMRDVSLLMYAVFAVICLITHFAAQANGIAVSVPGLVSAVLVGALLPVGTLIYYALLPSRRKYANFNFSLSMISAFIFMIVSVVVIVMSAFFGFKVNVADSNSLVLPLIVPIVTTLLIPISVVVYGLLYNSKKYHLK